MLRLLLVLVAVSLVSANSYWDVPCYANDCGQCENVCDAYCTGFYATSHDSCYPASDTVQFVDCYCELSGLGLSVVIILPTLFICWCCIAIGIGFTICNSALASRLQKSTLVERNDESFVIYSAIPSCFTRCGAVLLTIFTCGICLPFMAVQLLKVFFSRFWFAGEQGKFIGNPFDYCLNVFCVNSIFSCFTCGFWSCCGCAYDRTGKWIDENTVVASTGSPHGIYLFQARPAWCMVIAERFFSFITCGVAAPLFFVRNVKETVSQMRFGGKSAKFAGDTDEYVSSTWAPICGINFITCGLFSLCGLADVKTRAYVDQNIIKGNISVQENDQNTGIASNQNAATLPASTPTTSGYNALSAASPPQYQAPLVDEEYKPYHQTTYGTYQKSG